MSESSGSGTYAQGPIGWLNKQADILNKLFGQPTLDSTGVAAPIAVPTVADSNYTDADRQILAQKQVTSNQIYAVAAGALGVATENMGYTVATQAGVFRTEEAVSNVAAQLELTPDATVDDLLAHAEWPYSEGQTFSAGASATFVGGSVMRQWGLIRSFANANFWINVEDLTTEGNPPNIITFGGMDPSSKLNMNETDYQMAVRLYPGYTWVANFGGGPYLGANVIGMDGGVVNYIYAPRAPSLQEFFHLWDYTPPSGPPIRNAISDFISVLTLLPIQY